MEETNQEQQVPQQLKTNHNIRLVVLTTKQTVLCIFGEVPPPEGEQVKYYRILYPYDLTLGEVQPDGNMPINYSRWMPFSPVQEFRIGDKDIITVTMPDNNILENYVQELESFGISRDQLFYEEQNGTDGEPAEAAE